MSNPSADPSGPPLRSVFTANLPEIFRQLGISLVVSTYQAGKVILVRHDDVAGGINTHFRDFEKPMGIAVKGNRLGIGGANTVWEYRNVPAVAARLEPRGKNDACYLPRHIHITGDIDIHEMAWAKDDRLWLVNTRFGCLCTLDVDHSFYPRWRPPFISALAPEDRCHLNGLAMVDGEPRYVTALGETDTHAGWRSNKASGGILMDVASNKVVLRSLSMPHSPRWYRGKLWVLESGQGSLVTVDTVKGTWETVAKLPGFTRGIDFIGPLAFIGLSKVRESAVFSGIPIVADLAERICGVWVLNIETGEVLGFLRFESGVEEIFAVQLLHHTRFPDMLEWNDPLLGISYVLPDEALAEVVMPSEAELAERPQTYMTKGLERFRQGDYEQAVACFREVLNREPGYPDATYSLGVALAETGALQESLDCLLSALAKEPDRAKIHHSLANLYSRLRQPREAIRAAGKAIERQPDLAAAHVSLAVMLLQSGNYKRGFDEYEWRLKTGQVAVLQSPNPRWDGAAVAEKTVLLYVEGNDVRHGILLARYVPKVRSLCAKLLILCSDDLAPLLAVIPGVSEIRHPGSISVADYDVHVSIDSLPLLFNTTPETIPDLFPYIDIETLKKRKNTEALRLPDRTADSALDPAPVRKVGVVWSPHPGADGDGHVACPFDVFQAVFTVPGIQFYNLHSCDDSELTATLSRLPVDDVESKIKDYADLALLIDQMDLLVGVDCPAVHIAGALGKPVWVLQGDISNWYWPTLSSSTPWYPQARLFQQPQPGDWKGLIREVKQALSQ